MCITESVLRVSPGCCHGQLASEWQRHGDWQAGRLAGDSELEPLAGHGSRVYYVTPLALASELRVLGALLNAMNVRTLCSQKKNEISPGNCALP
jgi:hypothetical protein